MVDDVMPADRRQSRSGAWRSALVSPVAWVELFVLGNLAFLAVDIYVAHSFNHFHHPAEWIPFVFSLTTPALLAGAMALGRGVRPAAAGAARGLGLVVGWGAVGVGVSGLLFHLDDSFFVQQTLRNLVYTAPFAAPLSYAGLGLLLLLDRMVDPGSRDWARWVVLLALGGFVGNFVLSLADHAQNGFFDAREWIPVTAAALAVGVLAAVLAGSEDRRFLRLAGGVMGLEAAVALLGFWLHLDAILAGPMETLWEDALYGAPPFAPLLFADLAALAGIGLYALGWRGREGTT